DQIRDIRPQVGRQRKLAVAPEDIDHGIRSQTGGGGIPQRQRRQPVGMDVFWALFQLSKRGQGVARFGVARVIHLDQDRAIPLYDERIRGIVIHYILYPYALYHEGGSTANLKFSRFGDGVQGEVSSGHGADVKKTPTS